MKLRNVHEDPRGGYGCSAGVSRDEFRLITGTPAPTVRQRVEVHIQADTIAKLELEGVEPSLAAKIRKTSLRAFIQIHLEEAGGGATMPRAAMAR